MKQKQNLKLPLTETERQKLRQHKIKQSELAVFTPDELDTILNVPKERAKELIALAQFQQIPSVGIKFAEDLVYIGYYDIDSLRNKKGSELLDEYEHKRGYQTDPCVEDQFRLVVDYADHGDRGKNWWDFTPARKKYRAEHGYPADRPTVKWTEVKW